VCGGDKKRENLFSFQAPLFPSLLIRGAIYPQAPLFGGRLILMTVSSIWKFHRFLLVRFVSESAMC